MLANCSRRNPDVPLDMELNEHNGLRLFGALSTRGAGHRAVAAE